MKEFSVTILGSSAALPYKGRNLTSQLVNYGGRDPDAADEIQDPFHAH
jgi:ribonuclease BN (tRNA processing enzyme)